jgi:hypothetical protein|tara:strand:+ start:218 stop:361 length:144 start_codon:yes stop_codon:yes gene_type:complete
MLVAVLATAITVRSGQFGIARTPLLTGVDDMTSLSRWRTFAICAVAA